MARHYELIKAEDGQFCFQFKASNGKVVLTSQPFKAKNWAVNAIVAVRNNAPIDAHYERKTSSDGRAYFVLKAANGDVLARSEMYASNIALENAIRAVKDDAPNAAVTGLV